jgi:hypothetical protein
MIRIRFLDKESEARALGFLARRFSYKTWADGHTTVPEPALAALARERITYLVEGSASYAEEIAPLRDSAAVAV